VNEGVELRAVFCLFGGGELFVVLFSYRTICFFPSYFTFSRLACFPPVCIQGDKNC